MENSATFHESYRVIAVDPQSLILRGTRTGEVVTIKNADPATPLSQEDYPVGKLIALTVPATGAAN
jgi:hypothetical protein